MSRVEGEFCVKQILDAKWNMEKSTVKPKGQSNILDMMMKKGGNKKKSQK